MQPVTSGMMALLQRKLPTMRPESKLLPVRIILHIPRRKRFRGRLNLKITVKNMTVAVKVVAAAEVHQTILHLQAVQRFRQRLIRLTVQPPVFLRTIRLRQAYLPAMLAEDGEAMQMLTPGHIQNLMEVLQRVSG